MMRLFAVVCLMASFGAAGAQQPALSDLSGGPVGAQDPLRSARRLMQANQFAQAELELRGYLMQDDHSGEAHEMLAYALLRQNRPREALPEFTRAAALEKPSAAMLVHVGQAYSLLGDDADADKWTLRAVQADPKDADAWYGLGRIRYGEQRFADALSCFQRVLTLAPKSVKAENNLGLAYEALNRPAEAAAAYRQAIDWQNAGPVKERSEQPLLNLGTMLVHQGKLPEAEAVLTEAADIDEKDTQVHEQLGHVFLQKGDFAAAQREFARACKLDPGKSSLHFLLGQAYKRLGQRQEADAEFAVAAKLAHDESAPGAR